ncbi:MAG: hypothetical protein WBD73_01225, partial [Candidatus Acidiferrales bacterium]
ATQLNWGTSYLVEDGYRRFIKRRGSERHYVYVSRVVTLLLVVVTGYVSAHLASILSGWQDVLELGAGTGSVYLLRWYWWRINAWSEISAMATSLVVVLGVRSERLSQWLLHRPELFVGSSSVVFAKTALTATLATSFVWVIVTLLTKPEPDAKLLAFYRKVRPQITGWRPIAAQAPEIPQTHGLARNLWCWILGCAMTYGALFGVGKLLLRHWGSGTLLVLLALVTAWLIYRELSRSFADAPNLT